MIEKITIPAGANIQALEKLPDGGCLIEVEHTGNVSDGYHTFNELYLHRCTLFIALMKSYPQLSWRSKNHDDGSNFEGWFVAGMHLPVGDISYHLPIDLWNRLDDFSIETSDKAPKWDGHSSEDVIRRIDDWLSKDNPS